MMKLLLLSLALATIMATSSSPTTTAKTSSSPVAGKTTSSSPAAAKTSSSPTTTPAQTSSSPTTTPAQTNSSSPTTTPAQTNSSAPTTAVTCDKDDADLVESVRKAVEECGDSERACTNETATSVASELCPCYNTAISCYEAVGCGTLYSEYGTTLTSMEDKYADNCDLLPANCNKDDDNLVSAVTAEVVACNNYNECLVADGADQCDCYSTAISCFTGINCTELYAGDYAAYITTAETGLQENECTGAQPTPVSPAFRAAAGPAAVAVTLLFTLLFAQ